MLQRDARSPATDEPEHISAHLKELRSRVIKSVASVAAAACLVYAFIDRIMPHLVRPVGRLVFIAPHEAFVTNMLLALFGGTLLASPVILYQCWRFISIALKPNERRYALLFGPLSLIFFLAGAAFGYLVIIPIGMRFLLGFSTEIVRPMISIARYVSFVATLTLAFGVIFELPLASLFLTKLGLVTPRFLVAKRRHAVVLIFLTAAALTPPDVITQCLMAIPLLILYETGILFSKLAKNKKGPPHPAPYGDTSHHA